MAKELIERSKVEEKNTWNLKDMYESEKDWEKDVEEVKKLVKVVEGFEGKATKSAKNLLSVLDTYFEMLQKLIKAHEYTARLFDEDQGNSKHQSMNQKMMSLYVDVAGKTAFIDPEIIATSDETISSFTKEEKGLELYEKYIKEVRRLKDHTLSSEIERVAAMTGEMAQAPNEIYEAFTNVDIEFPSIKDENGEEVRITDARFVPLLESSDRRVREDTFKAYYATYKKYLNALSATYSSEVKARIFNSKLRGYGSNLEAAVDANNVSPAVYKNLVESVNRNLSKLHRYVSLRKKCLGVSELHMYDIYTPMIKDAAKEVTYEEAQETIKKALAVLGEDYVKLLDEAFKNRWCDVYENKGKQGGAYSTCAYGCHPYMLLNYNNSLDAMFTTAHEMGHSMHSWYSNQAQPFVYSEYKIFVAEVASTCNEILLLEYLLKNCTDKKEKAYLLNHYLDSFKGTVYRQTQFAEFEMRTNEMQEKGEALNKENLCALYKEINEKYYGKDMVSDEEISYEWARIPHFYYNFYVYQYATSFCAAVAIAERILKEGEPAVKEYKKFLSSGCTDAPVELLKIAGVDLTTGAPIDAALSKMGEIIDELEALV
ncbi:MAG: oligoendopeptidase F [Lachnospiraceae bacterium]|nr:oligoendopeptidase F [Lachnospiraceae bacterium]